MAVLQQVLIGANLGLLPSTGLLHNGATGHSRTLRPRARNNGTHEQGTRPSNYNSDVETANAAGADDNDGGGSDGDSIEALLRELD